VESGANVTFSGLQIIGPEGEDPTTIEFARLLAAEIGGFVPPPA
jgi:Asp-tRNA(Asn)/Glu-tRNA(Gln) amidotransferase A subunit family amidase